MFHVKHRRRISSNRAGIAVAPALNMHRQNRDCRRRDSRHPRRLPQRPRPYRRQPLRDLGRKPHHAFEIHPIRNRRILESREPLDRFRLPPNVALVFDFGLELRRLVEVQRRSPRRSSSSGVVADLGPLEQLDRAHRLRDRRRPCAANAALTSSDAGISAALSRSISPRTASVLARTARPPTRRAVPAARQSATAAGPHCPRAAAAGTPPAT